MNGRAKKFRHAPLLALALVVLLAGVGMFLLVRSFLNTQPQPTKQVVQEIHLVRPPPPPPDTPPPPPPPEEKVQVHEQQPTPDEKQSDEPPPSQNLGVDAEGGAGGDAFGLLGNKGGRDLLAGGGGSAFAWYAGLVKGELLQQLEDEQSAHKGSYSAEVKIWLRGDGSIERAQLVHSTGDRERDKAIESALARIGRISQAPPADMPQPINLKIVSRA